MKKLLNILDEIIVYGTSADENQCSPYIVEDLERNLIDLYHFSIHSTYTFDTNDYPEYKAEKNTQELRKNIGDHFPDFGLYVTILDIFDFEARTVGIGDAVDDLCDIISDLLEVKWRIEHNSDDDGLWFLQFSFENHIQEHILHLLNYVKQKNSL